MEKAARYVPRGLSLKKQNEAQRSGFVLERKKESRDMELSPFQRKRNGLDFF